MGTANFSICIDCALRTTISCLFDPKGVQSNQVYVERCQKVETGYEVRQLLTLPEHFVRLAVATVDRVGFSNLDPRRISLPPRLQKLSQALETGPLLDLKALADAYIMVLGAQLNNDVEAFPRDLHPQNPAWGFAVQICIPWRFLQVSQAAQQRDPHFFLTPPVRRGFV